MPAKKKTTVTKRGSAKGSGESLDFAALAEELSRLKISRCDRRELFRYQRFYRAYPQIVETLSPQLIGVPSRASFVQSLTGQSGELQRQRFSPGVPLWR